MITKVRAVVAAIVVAGVCVACGQGGSGNGSDRAAAAGNVGGLPVTHGESGVKPGAPSLDTPVHGAAGTEDDKVAEAAVTDVETFWKTELPADFGMPFKPVAKFFSYNSKGGDSKIGCGDNGKDNPNAYYCDTDNSISWDRGAFLPGLRRSSGQIAVVTVLAHEVGHAVQYRLGAKAGIDDDTPSLVLEQQADCFAGAYLHWVAAGKSRAVTLTTAEGLNAVTVATLHVRDAAGNSPNDPQAHGSGFDRTYALRAGFEKGPKECAGFNEQNIDARLTEKAMTRGDEAAGQGDAKITTQTVGLLKGSLDDAFKGAGVRSPAITAGGGTCPDGKSTPPVSYCPSGNTVSYDRGALAEMAAPVDDEAAQTGKEKGGRGDFAAFGEIASRYVLAIEKGAGASVDGPNTGLRTACLVGAWAKFAGAQGQKLRLSPGDLDEAIGEMLEPNSVIAAGLDGTTPTAGFDRVQAMQEGYLQGSAVCSKSYP